ncbi:hypothetical protein BCR32DRAFT_290137 [Anaeromyces robustus]|uniref:1-phosphatidylinositol 4-kinase n=1 Tax=Anaeromyces robustus TaxID=1754192 RepID=A0A1Y1XKK5_9FUNG|nr:hypothetical protein BCR32DRAFT_290137 [Anaeromyces robustus]|eukprot:ORX86288.1 hypothetical protein BCR32DRAFT_290137 [Anaeromyces robustus]
MNHSTLTLQLHLAEVLATSPRKEWKNIEKFMTFKVPEDNKVVIIPSRTQESIFSLAYYLEKSDGTHVEKILPYLISCYKYIEDISLNETLKIEDCYSMQFFSKALLEKLFIFAEKNNDYKDKLNELAWESLTHHTNIFSEISEKETVVSYSTLILNGIIQLLQIINCYIDDWSEEYLEKTNEIFKIFVKSSSLNTVHAISTYTFQGSKENLIIIKCLREYKPYFDKKQIIYSGLSQSTLIGLIFKFLKKILMTDIRQAYIEQQKKSDKEITQERRIWTALSYNKIDFISQFKNDIVSEIYQTSIRWFSEYTQFIFNSLLRNDNIADQDLYAFTTVLKTIVISALHLKHIDDDFVNKLRKIILDSSNVPKLPMAVVVLEALGIIMINFDHLQTPISMIIKNFLIQPSTSFIKAENPINTNISILRQCATDSISLALKAIDNAKLSKAVLVHYCDELYGISKETSGVKTIIYHNVLKAITTIACHINKKEIIDMAVPALTRRLNENEDQINALYCLVEIALTNDVTVFRDIINLLAEISKQENYEDNSKVQIIYKCFLIMARTPNLPPKKYELLLEILLFIFVSKTLLLPPKALKHRTRINEFTPLLLILKELFSHDIIHPELNCNNEMNVAFRNFWFYCILLGYRNGQWFSNWHSILSVIARYTPTLLVSGSNANSLETILESNSILRQKFSDGLQSLIKAECANVVTRNTDIKGLSFIQSAYLLTIYQLESMRMDKLDITYIFQYILNEATNNSGITFAMDTLADKILDIYLKKQEVNIGTREFTENIEKQIGFIVTNASHRLKRIRNFSRRFLEKIVTRFPSVLMNKKTLYLMLNILIALTSSMSIKSSEKLFIDNSSINDIASYLEVADGCDHKKELANEYLGLCKQWIEYASKVSSVEINGLLQSYLLNIHIPTPGASRFIGTGVTSQFGDMFGSKFINSSFMNTFSLQSYCIGKILGIRDAVNENLISENTVLLQMKEKLQHFVKEYQLNTTSLNQSEVEVTKIVEKFTSELYMVCAYIIVSENVDKDLLQDVCWIPIQMFNAQVMAVAKAAWIWLMTTRPELSLVILTELLSAWEWTKFKKRGLFSTNKKREDPFMHRITYTVPAKRKPKAHFAEVHSIWVEFLADRYNVLKYNGNVYDKVFMKLIQISFCDDALSNSMYARKTTFQLLTLGMRVLQHQKQRKDDSKFELLLKKELYEVAFSWFKDPPVWGDSNDKQTLENEIRAIDEFCQLIRFDVKNNLLTMRNINKFKNNGIVYKILFQQYSKLSFDQFSKNLAKIFENAQEILLLLLEDELRHLDIWYDPEKKQTNKVNIPNRLSYNKNKWGSLISNAWNISPLLAAEIPAKFKLPILHNELIRLITSNPIAVIDSTSALEEVISQKCNISNNYGFRSLLYWEHVSPIHAVSFLANQTEKNPWEIQYSLRVLEHFPADMIFFYVPQIVQLLRNDPLGYAEHYILKTAHSSQLFAHQIIWNMKANMFNEEKDGTLVPDKIKPLLDRMIEKIVNPLSGSDKEFYEREFTFFNEVTGISGKLMPFIKCSKPEKKKKIDEEMAKIKVDVGVYLPSNPDSIVIDIDYKSGIPLQSHAKAPFLATFKTKPRSAGENEEENNDLSEEEDSNKEIWESAIFKVGDDCRQDILALQLIAIFKSIFVKDGLDMYLYPYRVVATEPGCGVIECIPNSISRDQMGREKVNSLYDYYVVKFGHSDTVSYQKARANFIRSLAAYSIVLYMLQIKDRHNGNIMFDNEGYIIHIDFGFILDISPGGVNFENVPFKLTTEMLEVMREEIDSQPYEWFCELVIRGYLAIRPYATQIIEMVTLMQESGLPCFRGEVTLRKLKSRFQLDLTEQQAAEFMSERIKESRQNILSVGYDMFQQIQNEIPYHR